VAPCYHEGDLHGPNGVAWHVDVGIDHDHDPGPEVGRHRRHEGDPRLAGEVLLHRHDDAEADATEVGMATFSICREFRSEISRRLYCCLPPPPPNGGTFPVAPQKALRRGRLCERIQSCARAIHDTKRHQPILFAPPPGPSAPFSPSIVTSVPGAEAIPQQRSRSLL
jgi:hypothetical protein